jgi:hypothetical protein
LKSLSDGSPSAVIGLLFFLIEKKNNNKTGVGRVVVF